MIERVEETLRNLLSDPSAAVREAASESMDRLRAKRAVEDFRSRLLGGGIEERLRVVYAAGEMGGGEGVSLLLQALSDASAEVRGAAVRALAPFPSPQVLKSLWEMLPKEHGVVLGNLLETLGASGRKELAPHVEKFFDHADPEVRAKAVAAYSRMVGEGGWEKVLARAADPSDSVRAAVAAALGGYPSNRP